MLLVLLATLINLQGPSTQGVVVQTQEGSSLAVPNSLFNQLGYVDPKAKQAVLVGYSRSGEAFFAFSRVSGTPSGNPFEAIRVSGILELLRTKGLINPQFRSISDAPERESRLEVARIDDPGSPLDEKLILVETRKDFNGTSVFLLLGPQQEFYRLTPDFSQMVMNYTVTDREQLVDIAPLSIGLAFLFLLLNLAFAVYGFRSVSKEPDPLD